MENVFNPERDFPIILKRLKKEGFRLTEGVQYRDHTFRYVAKRTRFELDKFGFFDTLFMFNEDCPPEISALRGLSRDCLDYALKKSRIPLPRGFLRGLVCYSVALVDQLDAITAETIRTQDPPRHWAAFEFLIAYERNTDQLHYLERTPKWGRLYWDHFRKVTFQMLSPWGQRNE